MRERSHLLAILAAAVAVMLTAPAVRADTINSNDLVLTIVNGSSSVSCAMTGTFTLAAGSSAGCSVNGLGHLEYAGGIGSAYVTDTTSSTNVPGTSKQGQINQNSLQVTNNSSSSAGSLVVTLTGYNFTNPTGILSLQNGGGVSASGSTFAGSDSVSFQSYLDLNNTTSNNTSTSSCTVDPTMMGVTGAGCTSGTNLSPGVSGGPYYSLTNVEAITLSAGDSVNTTASTAAMVPEPGSMLLFGTGLTGLAIFLRRRNIQLPKF